MNGIQAVYAEELAEIIDQSMTFIDFEQECLRRYFDVSYKAVDKAKRVIEFDVAEFNSLLEVVVKAIHSNVLNVLVNDLQEKIQQENIKTIGQFYVVLKTYKDSFYSFYRLINGIVPYLTIKDKVLFKQVIYEDVDLVDLLLK